jgi:transcriptional regulator with XRE-family HTH domain
MIVSIENKIKKIRELKNFTQEAMADQLGISTRAYSKIESGETKLTIDRLNKISEIFKMPAIEVLGFSDKQVFNHCKQEGNIGINHNYTSKDLIIQFEKRIQHLEGEILFLRNLLET